MSGKITKHILEIRYKPDPRFLDKRGSVAAQIADQDFNQWNISNDRIDFNNTKHPELSRFFSIRNLGVTSVYPATTQTFLDTSENYIKSAWPCFPANTITRLGVRSFFLTKEDDFTKAFYKYKKTFLKLEESQLAGFGADLVDIGLPLNFVDGDDIFNIMTGPMQKKQSIEIFTDSAFDSGTYLEVDYFRTDISPHITQRQVIDFVKKAVEKSEKVLCHIQKLLAD
jgi:hypothetical protein